VTAGSRFTFDFFFHLFEEGLLVIIEARCPLCNSTLLDNPKVAVALFNQALVMRYDDDTAVELIDGQTESINGFLSAKIQRLVKKKGKEAPLKALSFRLILCVTHRYLNCLLAHQATKCEDAGD
jgi:hypothetical protein